MLPLVVLTHVTTCSSKFSDSSILIRCTQALQLVTLRTPLKDFDHQHKLTSL